MKKQAIRRLNGFVRNVAEVSRASPRFRKFVKHTVGRLACWYCGRPLMPSLGLAVRASLMIAIVITMITGAVVVNIVAGAYNDEESESVSKSVYYVACVIGLITCSFWLFLIDAIRRENPYDLVTANLALVCIICVPAYVTQEDPLSDSDSGSGWGSESGSSLGDDKETFRDQLRNATQGQSHIALMVIVLIVTPTFMLASLKVRKQFGWRLFMKYGADEVKKALYTRLMIFWCCWKIDVVMGLLTLVATWAFLFSSFNTSMVIALATGACSTVVYDLLLAICILRELSKCTLLLSSIGAGLPFYLIYISFEIKHDLESPGKDEYDDVWYSATIPGFYAAAAIRCLLLGITLMVVFRVFGNGMGSSFYGDEMNILPDEIRATLRSRCLQNERPLYESALRTVLVGTKARLRIDDVGRDEYFADPSGSNKSRSADSMHIISKKLGLAAPGQFAKRYVQVSQDGTLMRWSWKSYLLIDQIVDLQLPSLKNTRKPRVGTGVEYMQLHLFFMQVAATGQKRADGNKKIATSAESAQMPPSSRGARALRVACARNRTFLLCPCSLRPRPLTRAVAPLLLLRTTGA